MLLRSRFDEPEIAQKRGRPYIGWGAEFGTKNFPVHTAHSLNQVIFWLEKFALPLNEGITYLVLKKHAVENQHTVSITSLSTLYEFITSTICGRVKVHFEMNNIWSGERKRCRVGSRVYNEQFISRSADSCVLKTSLLRRRGYVRHPRRHRRHACLYSS